VADQFTEGRARHRQRKKTGYSKDRSVPHGVPPFRESLNLHPTRATHRVSVFSPEPDIPTEDIAHT